MLLRGQVVVICFTRVSALDRFFAGLHTKHDGHIMKTTI